MTDAPPTRSDGKLTVALVSETFWEADGAMRLKQRLAEVAERGADAAGRQCRDVSRGGRSKR